MKVAIYLIGQPRMIKTCIPLYKEIFEHLNPDYYIYNWNTREGKYVGYKNNTQEVDEQNIKDLYYSILGDSIKGIEIKPNTDSETLLQGLQDIFSVTNISSGFVDRLHHIINYVSQHHCSDLCNRLRKDKKIKYDLIIRIRTDLIFNFYYKRVIDYNHIDKTIEQLKSILDTHTKLNRPIVFLEKLQVTQGLLNTSDKIYAGSPDGIDILTNNILQTWFFNLLQNELAEITGYRTNHIIPPIDQHFSILSNIHLKNPELYSKNNKSKDLSMLTLENTPYVSRLYPSVIVRNNFKDSYTYDELYLKNREYLNEMEKFKNTDINLAKKYVKNIQ